MCTYMHIIHIVSDFLVDASGIDVDPLLYVAQMALARLLQFSYDSHVLAFLIVSFFESHM